MRLDRKAWLGVAAAVLGVSLILPVREARRWYRAPKRFTAALQDVSALSAAGRQYADVLPLEPRVLTATWLETNGMVFRADRFTRKGSGWERSASGVEPPVCGRAAPFTALTLERDGVRVRLAGQHVELRGKTNLRLPPDGSPAADPELGDGRLFYTRQLSNRWRVAQYGLASGEESILPFPERRGHAFLPLYWREARVLFYQGVGWLNPAEKEQGFVYRLFVLREKGELAVLPLGLADKPDLTARSVDGDPAGRTFAHTSGFVTGGLFVYELARHPFAPGRGAGDTRAGFALPDGCAVATSPELSRIHAVRFDPFRKGWVYLVATGKDGERDRVFEARLEVGEQRFHPLGSRTLAAALSLLMGLASAFFAYRMAPRREPQKG